MTFSNILPKRWHIRPVWVASLVMSVTLLLLPSLFKLDGRAHADWQQFLGRFHPLVVHLPIGLILLVPLLEGAGRYRPALRETASLVLALSFVSCLGALTLGYLLAYGSGDAGAVVTRHMWGGISLTIGVLLCLLVRPWWASGDLRHVYPGLLMCVLLLLAWAAHQGGSLTHGNNYLIEYLPAQLKRWPGIGTVEAKTPLAPDSFYSRHINPVLDANCVTCHGEGKVKGGLRVDSYELLMKGGKDGPAIVAGKPEQSLLLERVTLPSDHKKFMPAEGKPPLKSEEIAWIKAWVLQGASPTATSLQGIVIQEESREVPLQPVGDYSKMMPQIAQMAKAQGAKLVPVSNKWGDGLILNAVDVAGSFSDAQLAQFEKFAPYIVEAELGRTAVTNGCFDTLGKFTHLRALHLEGTAVTGDGLAKLTPLAQLTYVNLSETRVTKAAVAPLGSMKNLRHLYLYNTPAQPVSPAETMQPTARSSP
ncbi:MAG TPA: c-type cytochrome domain-containing protein [Edaphobacter sp.]|nr:c-type cytochrome domain-containing protein [Edaphobacter sp.]